MQNFVVCLCGFLLFEDGDGDAWSACRQMFKYKVCVQSRGRLKRIFLLQNDTCFGYANLGGLIIAFETTVNSFFTAK